jgi:hypothetical protein
MKLIDETPTHQIFEDFYQGHQVRFLKDKITDEFSVHADDLARVIGFKNTQEMMSDDTFLDIVNDQHKKTGEFPIKTIY